MPSLKLKSHPSMVPVIKVDHYSDAPRSVDSVRSSSSLAHFVFPTGRSYSFDTGRAVAENGLLPISYR